MKIILLLLTLFSTNLLAYTIAIYTDQTDKSKAQEVANLLKNTYPFSQFNIEFKIESISTEDLGCTRDPNIKRLILCDTNLVTQRAALKGYDQAMIVWDNGEWGGSGGSVPAMTKIMPTRVMIHEYLHCFNFSDEYVYAAAEASRYCPKLCTEGTSESILAAVEGASTNPNPAAIETNPDIICQGKQKTNSLEPNLAYIHPYKEYNSNFEARLKHKAAIAWFKHFNLTDKITNSNGTKLGTGKVSGEVPAPTNGNASTEAAKFGLYRGKTCDNADPKLPTWSPSPRLTVMNTNSLGLGPEYEKIMYSMLESRNIPLKATVSPPEPEPETRRSGSTTISR